MQTYLELTGRPPSQSFTITRASATPCDDYTGNVIQPVGITTTTVGGN